MIVEFNWNELIKHGQSNESKVILFYCLYVNTTRKNRWLAQNAYDLKRRLQLTDIPQPLFSSRYIVQQRRGLISNYECIEPQTYAKNCSFLFGSETAKTKADYLELLSLRHINNNNTWVPIDYVRYPLRNNSLTYIIKKQVHFKPEETNI